MTAKTPSKDRVIALVNKTHVSGVPNWTTAEMQEAHTALRDLGFLWFRAEQLAADACR